MSRKSIILPIASIAAPRAVELTVIAGFCPPLQPYFSLVYTRFNVHAMRHDDDAWWGLGTNFLQSTKSTSVNLQFAKLEQHIYGLCPRHENAQ